jgi:hypothetical protein
MLAGRVARGAWRGARGAGRGARAPGVGAAFEQRQIPGGPRRRSAPGLAARHRLPAAMPVNSLNFNHYAR